jgi:hypothetical protein
MTMAATKTQPRASHPRAARTRTRAHRAEKLSEDVFEADRLVHVQYDFLRKVVRSAGKSLER